MRKMTQLIYHLSYTVTIHFVYWQLQWLNICTRISKVVHFSPFVSTYSSLYVITWPSSPHKCKVLKEYVNCFTAIPCNIFTVNCNLLTDIPDASLLLLTSDLHYHPTNSNILTVYITDISALLLMKDHLRGIVRLFSCQNVSHFNYELYHDRI